MKFVKVLASLLMVFMVCSAFSLKGNDKSKGMYIVGVSASFSDSLVYFTDIQYLDSVLCSYPHENLTVLTRDEIDRDMKG